MYASGKSIVPPSNTKGPNSSILVLDVFETISTATKMPTIK